MKDPETQTRYVVCQGDEFINRNPIFGPDYNLNDDDFGIKTLDQDSVCLGRKLDMETGYEPVGVDVVTYVRDKNKRRKLNP